MINHQVVFFFYTHLRCSNLMNSLVTIDVIVELRSRGIHNNWNTTIYPSSVRREASYSNKGRVPSYTLHSLLQRFPKMQFSVSGAGKDTLKKVFRTTGRYS